MICDGSVCCGNDRFDGCCEAADANTSVVLVRSVVKLDDEALQSKRDQREVQNCETLLEIMSEIYKKHTRLTKAQLTKMYDTRLVYARKRMPQVGLCR